jgi:hypothetical protein
MPSPTVITPNQVQTLLREIELPVRIFLSALLFKF